MNLLLFIFIVNSLDYSVAYIWFQKNETTKIPEWCEAVGYQNHDEYTGKLFAAAKMIASEKVIGKADAGGRGFFLKDGREYHLDAYELLCPDPTDWVEKYGDTRQAVPVGSTIDGQNFYICRGKYKSSILPGKFRRSADCCFVLFAHQERCAKEYSILLQSA